MAEQTPTQYSISQLPTEATENHADDLYEVSVPDGASFISEKKKHSTLVAGLATEASLDAHTADTDNPHATTKAQVGLSVVPNVDATKRENHSGTQAISTVTGLQTTLDSKAATSSIPEALTDLDTTVTGAQLDALKTKVDGIAAGAEQNVNADWNASSGDAQILNKPTLGTAASQNSSAFATAAQGAKADSAVQNLGDLGLTATATELNYTDGVTSAIQTQLDGKVPTSRTVNGKALSSNVTLTQDDVADGSTAKQYTTAEKTKLAGIATGATANDTDANLKNRANHTGTQPASTISDFNSAADARITAQKGQTSGLASLDGSGKVPTAQLPAVALTDVYSVASQSAQLALTAQEGDVAIRSDQSKSYVHNGGSSGTMSDWNELLTPTDQVLSVNGKTGAVSLTKADVALGNVDNTSDSTKNAATATLTNKTISGSSNTFANIPQSAVTGLTSDLAAKADSSSLSTVATTGAYNDLSGKPTLGTAAAQNTTAFATAAQGAKADSAVQPGDLPTTIVESLVEGTNITIDATDPAHPIVSSTGGGGGGAVDSVNGQTGSVTLDADDIDDSSTSHKFATATQLSNADSAVQPADLADVATTGAYSDLTGTPTLGTAAAQNSAAFATAAQGATADTAVQPGDLGDLAVKDTVAVADISATGTASSSTYLRGDGSWATPTGGGGGASNWGDLAGTLSDQTDLQAALDAKAEDDGVIHTTGTETVAGTKTFTDGVVTQGNLQTRGIVQHLTSDGSTLMMINTEAEVSDSTIEVAAAVRLLLTRFIINEDMASEAVSAGGTSKLRHYGGKLEVSNSGDAFTPVATEDDVNDAVSGLAEASDLTAHTSNTSNPHSVTKTHVGLSNVTNDTQLKAADLDTDSTMAANADTKVPSQKAVRTALGGKVGTSTTVNGHALSSNVTVTADDVLPSQAGNSGKVLTTDGSTASWDTLAGGGGGSSAPAGCFGHSFESNANSRFAESSINSATNTWNVGPPSYLRMSAGTTSGGRTVVYFRDTDLKTRTPAVFKNPRGSIGIGISGTTGSGNAYLRFFSANSFASNKTVNQVGLNIIKSGGTVTYSSSTGDGTTETATALSGVGTDYGDRHAFSFSLTEGTNCKFYYDGVLKNTHTTNLPSTSSTAYRGTWIAGFVDNNSTTDNYTMDLSYATLGWDLF